MKIDDKISLSEKKLIEQRTKFEDRKKELGELVKERGRLQALVILDGQRNDKRIIQIDKQRDEIHAELEVYPSLLSEMEAKIGALKKEKEEGILKENLGKQKRAARKVEEFSQKLGSLLSEANRANIELQKHRSQYFKLGELTSQNIFEKPTTPGSLGSLRMLAGVINAELEGQPRQNPRYPPPGPPI